MARTIHADQRLRFRIREVGNALLGQEVKLHPHRSLAASMRENV